MQAFADLGRVGGVRCEEREMGESKTRTRTAGEQGEGKAKGAGRDRDPRPRISSFLKLNI